MKFKKILVGIAILFSSFSMQAIRKTCDHGELNPSPPQRGPYYYHSQIDDEIEMHGRRVRAQIDRRAQESVQRYQIQKPVVTEQPKISQPKPLVDASINAVAQRVDNSEITLEQAKKILPIDLYPKLEAEVQRLQKQNPNKTRMTPELEQAMEEATLGFEKEAARN